MASKKLIGSTGAGEGINRMANLAQLATHYRDVLVALTMAAFVWVTLPSQGAEKPSIASGASMVHSIICKEPGRYIGWPTVARRADGELLVVFSGDRDQHVCPYGKTQLVRSRDSGKTWSKPETINETVLDDRDAGILVCQSGVIIMSWFTSLAFETMDCRKMYGDEVVDAWQPYVARITPEQRQTLNGHWIRRSLDGGRTWLPRQRIVGSTPHGPIQLRDGRVLFLGSTRVEGNRAHVTEESTDDGKSWHVVGRVPFPQGIKGYWGEPHLAETTSGRLVAHFRHSGGGPQGGFLWQSESEDGGRSWTMVHRLNVWGYPPHLLCLSDDRLLTTYGRRRKPYGQRACLSRDGGQTWEVDKEIVLRDDAPNGDLGYPSSVELGDGQMLTVYYQIDRAGEKTCLMCTRWTLPP